MSENKKAIWAIAKAILFVILLPLALIWFVWNKTDWKKQNKWIATVGIAVVFLIILGYSGKDEVAKKETGNSEDKIVELEKQLAEEKEKNSASTETTPGSVEENFKVAHVVDGDTVKLENGQVVRFIGIDAPETVDPEKPVQCFGKEASAEVKKLLTGQEVKLEKDVSETDKYNRILRYVYVGETFVNDYLVRNGFAKASNFPPDEKFKKQFQEAQDEAKNNKRGLWADGACDEKSDVSTNVSTPVRTTVPIAVPTPAPVSTSGSFACNCSKTCPQMSSCAEAQFQLNSCGCTRRDADHDGTACDADCQ